MTRPFPLDDPLRATAVAYRRAGDTYTALAIAGGEIATALDGGLDADGGFSGRAAESVAALMTEHVERIRDVEILGSSLAEVFVQHADELAALETEVADVLARGRRNWDRLLAAERAEAEAEADHRLARQRLATASLGVAVDPSQAIAAHDEADRARVRWRAAESALDGAEAAFGLDRTALEDLADAERLLDEVTVAALDDQDLASVADPGFLNGLGGLFQRAGSTILDGLTGGGGPGLGLPGIALPGGGGLPGLPPVPDPISDAWHEAGDRLQEYGRYLVEANRRREDRGGRFRWAGPDAGFDAFFEDGAAAVGILGMGGELYHDDAGGYCGGSQSCIVGVATPLGGAITLGHTVLYTPERPRHELIAHEQQHIHQYEELGTRRFLTRAALSFAVDVALGGDGYVDTHYEREAYYVQDHYGDPAAAPSPDLEVPDGYFHSETPDDYNFGWWTSRPRPVKELSAEITEWIWEWP
ncbi:MAG: hypothetical protein AAGA59_04555 [Actinomycetota bacterium]